MGVGVLVLGAVTMDMPIVMPIVMPQMIMGIVMIMLVQFSL
jgi:hypothetical protein